MREIEKKMRKTREEVIVKANTKNLVVLTEKLLCLSIYGATESVIREKDAVSGQATSSRLVAVVKIWHY